MQWLEDGEIGALPETWNWLEGWSEKRAAPPNAVHYTRGGPWFAEWRNADYAGLWLSERKAMLGGDEG